MKEKQAWIMTEGGSGIGFGHLMRTSAIYEELVRRNIAVKFFVYGLGVQEFLEDYCYENINWRNEEYLSTVINEDDYVVVDSYLADEKICAYISKLAKKVLFFDDTKRIIYPRGLVLNSSPLAKDLAYQKIVGVKYLLGAEFVILRELFQEKFDKKLHEQVNTVLLTLGGADNTNTMPLLIKLLNDNYPQLKKYIVMGSSPTEQIKPLLSCADELCGNITAERMRMLMLKADFAIIACGQTLLEIAQIGLPTIAIQTADNQKYNATFWLQNESILYAGKYSDSDLLAKLEKHLIAIQDINVRQELVSKGLAVAKQFVGVRVIVDELLLK